MDLTNRVLVVAYGAGMDSTAMLVEFARRGIISGGRTSSPICTRTGIRFKNGAGIESDVRISEVGDICPER